MILINQTDFTFETGNCMQACVASLFELPLDDVPNFNQDGPSSYDTYMFNWCAQNNLIALDVTLQEELLQQLFKDTFLIAINTSPRATTEKQNHAVIVLNNEIVHDPHPDNTGIELPPYCYTVFIVRDPGVYSPLPRIYGDIINMNHE